MSDARLRDELLRFRTDAPLEKARTPPSSWYVEPAVYALELQRVFSPSWCIAARAEQLEQPGSFVCLHHAGQPIVVIRGGDGVLRAFYNVCSHHATEVVSGAGRCNQLVCPYHGWTYDIDGTLRKAPEMGAIQGVSREQLSLRSVPVATLGPLVFVCLQDPPPRSIEDDFGGVQELLAPTGWEQLTFVTRRTWQIACNWKVFIDNYLDGGYHIAHLHKGLADELELGTYETTVHGRYSVQTSESVAQGDRFTGTAVYAWLYPNVMINRYGSWMDTNWVVPDGPASTIVHIDWYVADPDRPSLDEELSRSGSVQDEDVAICESVQRGLASRAYDRGYYAVGREVAAHAFHRLLAIDLQPATL